MLATSWKAPGAIRAAWNRLDVQKDKRGELSRRTGIPETNLSGMNTGRLPITREAARRIAAAVPGLTEAELGAPAAAVVIHPAEQGAADATLDDVLGELQLLRDEVAELRGAVHQLEAEQLPIEAQQSALGRG